MSKKRKPNNPKARVERFSRAVLRQHRVAVVNIEPAGWQGLVDYGSCKYQGVSYHYDAERDALVRMDVWMARIKEGGAEAKRIADAEREKWMAAQGSLL